ncbi:MAG: SDR family NAD(P)-dependent oxidoreductase [Solirubrobacteraceae bacterium]
MLSALIDQMLDLTVVGGYTSVGYRVRERGWRPLPRMDGKVVVVTGATAGLGLAAAEGFAELGATPWLLARNRARGESVRAALQKRHPGSEIRLGVCDLSDLNSIRGFATGFLEGSPRLDVLVNNAGVLPHTRELSADGIELTLATNVIGPLLLTQLLLPALERSAPARIINVSSGGMYTQRLTTDDLQSERGEFDGTVAYAKTKRMQVVLTEILAARLKDSGVTVHAMHPGWADTPGLRSSLPRFQRVVAPLLRNPQQGADTIVWLGAAPEPASNSGGFWHDRRRRPTHLLPKTHESAADRDRLWSMCDALTSTHQDASSSNAEPE